MKYFVLIPIVLPVIMAIIGTKVKFKKERERNAFLYTTVMLNLSVLIEYRSFSLTKTGKS